MQWLTVYMTDTKLQVQLSAANVTLAARAANAAWAAGAALAAYAAWLRMLIKQRHVDAASLENYPAVLAKAAGAFGSTYSAYYYLLGKLWSLYYRIVTYNT